MRKKQEELIHPRQLAAVDNCPLALAVEAADAGMARRRLELRCSRIPRASTLMITCDACI